MKLLSSYPVDKLMETYHISVWCGVPLQTGEDELGQPIFGKSGYLAQYRYSDSKQAKGETIREAVEAVVEQIIK